MKKLEWTIGKTIASDSENYYRIIQLLGEGKNATAYLALKTGKSERGTFHVVKVMLHPKDKNKLAAFEKEKDVLTKLNHSSIINIHDQGKYLANRTTYPFYMCNYYATTLEQLIRSSTLKLNHKLSYAIQLSSALEYLASNSILHCDVKPGNIYVSGSACVLADFGLSQEVDTEFNVENLPSLHRYRSPDIVNSISQQTPICPKSDVFLLGLTLTELFTGQNPCKQATIGTDNVEISELPNPYGIFGTEIGKILGDMLITDSRHRPTAGELIDRWQGVLFKAFEYILKVEKNVY